MSRHHAAARSSCGWLVLVAPVQRWIATLVTDVPSGIVLKRTRATVWTVPVGLLAHVYHFSATPFHRAGSLREAGCTRSRNSTSWELDAALPVTRGLPVRPISVLKKALPPCSSVAVSPMPTKPPPPCT